MRIDELISRSERFYGGLPAIEDGSRTVTYGRLAAEVRAAAAGLAGLGLGSGDRVAVLAKNRIEYVALYFAIAQIGAVAVPVNWRLGRREIAYILADSDARAVVAEQAYTALVDAVAGDLPTLEHRLALDEAEPGWKPLPSSSDLAFPAIDGGPDDPVIQMYTSGTTGAPKGALLTHRNLLALTASWLLDMPLASGNDRFLQVTPLFHVGAVLMALSNVAAGSHMILLPEFAPGPAAEALAERGITKALFVPAMLRWLLSEAGVADRAYTDLGMIVYGAAPIPPPLLVEAIGVFECGFLQGYGLTETAGVITTLRPEAHVAAMNGGDAGRLSSAGRAVLCSDVLIFGPDGRTLPPGEPGEIVARGDNIMPGYWKLPDASREALRDGWFHTGDVGWMDDEGYVTIIDRLKDMVLIGGENVYPREAEAALEDHPEVTEAAVIGIPHDVWGEELLAFVARVPDAASTDRMLVAHCRERLARFKCPTRIEFVGSLPRNAAGKILKAELREPFWAGRDRRV